MALSRISSVPLTGSDQVVAAFPGIMYFGFSIRETAGSTAVVRIYDSHDSTTTGDTLLDSISLSANESAREYYNGGLAVNEGLFIDIVSGAVEGCVRVTQSQGPRDYLDSRQ